MGLEDLHQSKKIFQVDYGKLRQERPSARIREKEAVSGCDSEFTELSPNSLDEQGMTFSVS